MAGSRIRRRAKSRVWRHWRPSFTVSRRRGKPGNRRVSARSRQTNGALERRNTRISSGTRSSDPPRCRKLRYLTKGSTGRVTAGSFETASHFRSKRACCNTPVILALERRRIVMKRIFVPTTSGTDWQRLLGKPKLHWKSGHSAMSAAACWETNHPNLPSEIVRTLEGTGEKCLEKLELLLAVSEWEVDLPGGDRASQTDILAVARNESGLVILGVEAKVDEPFGPTLGEKRSEASSGQTERISYLERELGSPRPLGDSIRYQLLHRTVSALLTARAFHAQIAVMLIQSFSPVAKWREDFEAFVNALDSTKLSADVFALNTAKTPRLLVGWCTGAEEFLSVGLPSAL